MCYTLSYVFLAILISFNCLASYGDLSVFKDSFSKGNVSCKMNTDSSRLEVFQGGSKTFFYGSQIPQALALIPSGQRGCTGSGQATKSDLKIEGDKCDLDLLDSIQEQLSCRTGISLAACVGIGAFVAGRTLSSHFLKKNQEKLNQLRKMNYEKMKEKRKLAQLNSSYKELFNRVNRQVKSFLTTEINAKFRSRDTPGAIKDFIKASPTNASIMKDLNYHKGPFITLKADTFFIDSLVEKLVKASESAELSGRNIKEVLLEAFKGSDLKFLETDLGKKLVVMSLEGIKSKKLKILKAAIEKQVSKVQQKLTKHRLTNARLRKSLNSKGKAIKIPGGAGRLAGGAMLGLPLLLVTEVALGSKTGCAMIKDDYINVDSNCKPEYKVDQKVLDFLDLPGDEQLEVFNKEAEVCDFYKNLNKKLELPPKLSNLTCHGKGRMSFDMVRSGLADSKLKGKNFYKIAAEEGAGESATISFLELDATGEPISGQQSTRMEFSSEGILHKYRIPSEGIEKIVYAKDVTEGKVSGTGEANLVFSDLKSIYHEALSCCSETTKACQKLFSNNSTTKKNATPKSTR